MAKDASMFSSLSGALEQNIYEDDDYALAVARSGDVKCQHDKISNIYQDVPSLSTNQCCRFLNSHRLRRLLSFHQITLS